KILTLNCGSSSIKYKIIDPTDCERVYLEGTVERIRQHEYPQQMEKLLAEILSGKGISIDGVGHRFVHGGDSYTEPVLVTDQVQQDLELLKPLAPLHNPHNFNGIHLARHLLPAGIRHVAVFDTAFHAALPQHIHQFPLPYKLSSAHGLRKFGFHGISYAYICERLRELDVSGNVVIAHLGAGCSVAAVQMPPNGSPRCTDTSMGYSPAAGLMMGTRCGTIDPAVISFLLDTLGPDKDVFEVLNKESGLLGVTGETQDMRDIVEAIAVPRAETGEGITRSTDAERTNRFQLALDMFTNRAAREMAAVMVSLPGPCSCIVFTAGIGTNSPMVRTEIMRQLKAVLPAPLIIDDIANNESREIISDPGSYVKVMTLPTDEETQIARYVLNVLQAANSQNV
ncbi:unnamed protein product, partial [Ectocarpus fasciculatus]